MPHKDPEAAREYHRLWRLKNTSKIQRWSLESREKRTPESHRASESVRRAIKAGVLVRPEGCEACGKMCKPEAAHFNYVERLRVRWLCGACHKQWDTEVPKNGYDATGESRSRVGPRNQNKTHCPQGHAYSPENTYMRRGRFRVCATCKKASEASRRQARRAVKP